jgi:signal transduction histidine kinase
MLPKDQFLFFIVVIAIVFFILFLFFILVIILNVKKRKQKEIEALNAVINMQESERRRIAGDMHDQIGPMLSAIKLKINSIRQMKNSSEIDDTVKETTKYVDTLISDMRQVVRNLSPTNLNRHGLIQAIEDFKSVIEQNNNMRFEFMHEGMGSRMKENAEINIYRIVAELINNSLKHSECTVIKLLMKKYENKTIIIYSDDGINVKSEKLPVPGMGLKSIESRIKSFKGTLHRKEGFDEGAYYSITFDNYILLDTNE